MRILLRLACNAAALWVATRFVPGVTFGNMASTVWGGARIWCVERFDRIPAQAAHISAGHPDAWLLRFDHQRIDAVAYQFFI